MTTTDQPRPAPAPDLRRVIGFWGGIAVMVGVIIGSGIFRTPTGIAAQLSSPGLILLLWFLGGVLCLAGAFTYAELASRFPDSGGVYVFIREGFGELPAFVFGWSYLVIVKPFAAGGIAFVFAEHLNILLRTSWDPRIATSVMLLSLTFINIRGVRISTGVAGVLTALKVGALVAIVALCLALGKGAAAALGHQGHAPSLPGSLLPGIAGAMALILWTYDGWADVGSIAGEIRSPQRTLPRIYVVGTAGIIALYLAVNVVYFMLVPLPEMRALGKDASIAPVVMERLIGPMGASAVAFIVMASTLGSSHSSIMTGARVSYAQAKDGLLFRFIAHVHPRYHTPDAALIAQVLLSIVAVWLLGSFQQLAEGFVFTMWIFALAGAALFVLRARERRSGYAPNSSAILGDAPVRFRCPGYPLVPGLFILTAAGMTFASIAYDPWHTLPWLLVLLLGAPVYFVWRRLVPRQSG